MNPGRITPWWVTQNQQRAAMAAQQTPMNWQQTPSNWGTPQTNYNWGTSPMNSVQTNPGFVRQPPTAIPGRVIQNPNEITAEDVPMNGTVSLFPAADYSYIIAKQWNQNGTIDSIRYIPEQIVQTPEEVDPFKKEVFERFDKIEQMLSGTHPKSNVKSNQKAPNQNKQEDTAHE